MTLITLQGSWTDWVSSQLQQIEVIFHFFLVIARAALVSPHLSLHTHKALGTQKIPCPVLHKNAQWVAEYQHTDTAFFSSQYFTNKIITIRNSFPPINPSIMLLAILVTHSGKLLHSHQSLNNLFWKYSKKLPQIMQHWCHSHKTAVWKPWCSAPYNHQHNPHITGFWSCTTRLQNGYCQTPAQKTLLWPKCIEKVVLHQLLAHFHENNLCNPFHTQHRDCTPTHCKRLVKCYGQRQNLRFTLTGSFSCVWYFWSLDSSFMSRNCLWHPLYRSPVVLIIPSGQKSVWGCQQFCFLFISSYVWCSTGLSAGTCAICFVHYSTFTVSDIIANHPVNHQLFADDIKPIQTKWG